MKEKKLNEWRTNVLMCEGEYINVTEFNTEL